MECMRNLYNKTLRRFSRWTSESYENFRNQAVPLLVSVSYLLKMRNSFTGNARIFLVVILKCMRKPYNETLRRISRRTSESYENFRNQAVPLLVSVSYLWIMRNSFIGNARIFLVVIVKCMRNLCNKHYGVFSLDVWIIWELPQSSSSITRVSFLLENEEFVYRECPRMSSCTCEMYEKSIQQNCLAYFSSYAWIIRKFPQFLYLNKSEFLASLNFESCWKDRAVNVFWCLWSSDFVAQASPATSINRGRSAGEYHQGEWRVLRSHLVQLLGTWECPVPMPCPCPPFSVRPFGSTLSMFRTACRNAAPR